MNNQKHFFQRSRLYQNTRLSLWDITTYNTLQPAPDNDEFEYIVRTKGIDEAISIVNNTIKEDTLTDILQWYNLNRMGYTFLNEKKYKEAIGIFKLNTELHPGDANLFDSLAEGYEITGDKEHMKKASVIVMDLLNKKDSLTDPEKGLKENAEKRLN